MQHILKQARQSSFLRYNVVLFIGSGAIGVLNYLFYPVLGRLLGPSDFGEVQALFSIFGQVVVFLNVLGLVTINIVANSKTIKDGQYIILELEKLAVGATLVVLLVAIITSGALQRFFNFSSGIPFVILAFAIILCVPSTFRNSYLRGKQKFGLVSWVGVITAGGDLILSAVLVVMGAGTIGAIIGLVLAQALAFAFAAIAARRHGFIEHVRRRLIRLPNLRRIFPELKYATYVLIASLGITLFYSMDILIVKHYFDARIAGLYAGIATVSRIIFFSTDSISQVLVPAVKITASASDNQQVLLKSFMLLFSVGGLIWLVFALLPQLIVRVLMGSKYLPYASLLPRLSLVLLLVSVANLVVTYHMALRRIMVAFIVIIGLGATLLIVSHHHDSLVAVVNSLLFGTLTLLILLSGWMTVSKVKDNLQA